MRTESVELGIIIVTFNSADDIAACLAAIPPATTRSHKVVVVDNASTDRTRAIIQTQFADVTLIANPVNRYYAAANNQGLEVLDARYVLLLNPDVILSPSSLDRMIEKLEGDPTIAAVAPRMVDAQGTYQPSVREFPGLAALWFDLLGLSFLWPRSRTFGRWRMGYFDGSTERDVDQPMASCLMIRGEVLQAHGLFDERYPMFFNDVDWCRRVVTSGGRVRYLPDVVVRHTLGASTRQNKSRMIWMSHMAFLRYLWQYEARGPLKSVAVILTIPFLGVAAILRIAYWSVRGILARI